MCEQDLIQATTAEVSRRLSQQQAGHGFDHVQRVVKSARIIQAEEGGDMLTVELAAVLHVVGDAKFHNGIERSGQISREILKALDASESLVKQVVSIVDRISFRKRKTAGPLSLEGQIVQDADRLDALGAIGIVRTIEYGTSIGQPFFAPQQADSPSGVSHFYEKLFKLRALMNTETAKRMAIEREEFMRNFLDQFYREYGISGHPA